MGSALAPDTTGSDEIAQIIGTYRNPPGVRRVLEAYLPDLIYRGLGLEAVKVLLSCISVEELDERLNLLETFGGEGDDDIILNRGRERPCDEDDVESLGEYVREHDPFPPED